MARHAAAARSCRPHRPTRSAAQPSSERRKNRAGRANETADQRQREAFFEEQATDRARREADGAQQTDLADALLDAELEEQRRQGDRRDDQEETEVGEVFAEVGRAARRRQTLGPTSRTDRPNAIGSNAGAEPLGDRVARGGDLRPLRRCQRIDVNDP